MSFIYIYIQMDAFSRYLDIILYHRQQIVKERTQRGEHLPEQASHLFIQYCIFMIFLLGSRMVYCQYQSTR